SPLTGRSSHFGDPLQTPSRRRKASPPSKLDTTTFDQLGPEAHGLALVHDTIDRSVSLFVLQVAVQVTASRAGEPTHFSLDPPTCRCVFDGTLQPLGKLEYR